MENLYTPHPRIIKGRAASHNPVNRFEPLMIEADPEWLEQEPEQEIKTLQKIQTVKPKVVPTYRPAKP